MNTRRHLRAALLVLLAVALVPSAGHSQTAPVPLRSGDHPGFGRLVFDLPPGVTSETTIGEGRVVVRFTPVSALGRLPELPRNVRAVTSESGQVAIISTPGSTVQRMMLDTHLVLDFMDVAAASPRPPPEKPRPVAAPPPRPVPAIRQTVSPAAREPPEMPRPAAASVAVPARPPVPQAGPVQAGPVQIVATTPPGADPAIQASVLIPFERDVGAAAFRRQGVAMVVFDARRPIDLAGLRDVAAFAGATVRLLPAGTVLSFPIDPASGLVLAREPAGWTISRRPIADTAARPSLRAEYAASEVRFLTDVPGQVVALADPDSGALLLVGTLRQPPAAIQGARQGAEFGTPETWLGLVVQPVSDQLSMRPTGSGFTVTSAAARPLAISTEAAGADSAARHFSRRFDLPGLPVDALLHRLQAAQSSAAAATAQTRTARRVEVAQALIALGFGAEAQSLLALTLRDDSRAAGQPEIAALQGVAALLAGRPAEATGLADPRLDGNDEIALWRGLLQSARADGDTIAAPALAAMAPLLLTYPEPLRARLLPRAAETLVAGGKLAEAHALLDPRKDQPDLDLARAALARAENRETEAAEILARVIGSRDRLARSRAIRASVEQRLAQHSLSPMQAADALEQAMYSWRGDDQDLALRQRVATLRDNAGQWRPAIATLREAATLWPERAAQMRPQLAAIFACAMTAEGQAAMKPFDLVTLAEENADLLPEGDAGRTMAVRIADRLAALELPARAATVLRKLVDATAPGPARAEFGTRLARLRQDAGDHPGALEALTLTATPDLPPPDQERRTLIFARSAAALGDLGSALAALADITSPAGLALRADLLETAQDWRGTLAALSDLMAAANPPNGMLDGTNARLLLRLASAAVRANDGRVLTTLRTTYLARLPKEAAAMLDMLSAEPVGGVADLPRATQEMRLAKGLSNGLRTLTQ